MTTRHALVDTQLGDITLVASGNAIAGLYFPRHWYKPAKDALGERMSSDVDSLLSDAAQQLISYLNGTRTTFDLPLDAAGDTFQQQVWALLLEVPFGETTTYGALAQKLGDKSLAPSVGQAVGRNPLCVFIPCHRVLGSDGSLRGYAGGLRRKRFLLELEEPALVHVEHRPMDGTSRLGQAGRLPDVAQVCGHEHDKRRS
jgi:methylated-DNA-[protein]-cysteine S-methyltransferase